MRIAATADLHFTPERYASIEPQMRKVRDEADVLVVAGDLTNYGKTSELEPLINELLRLVFRLSQCSEITITKTDSRKNSSQCCDTPEFTY
jgi:Icc-related predicted phosphoesterase